MRKIVINEKIGKDYLIQIGHITFIKFYQQIRFYFVRITLYYNYVIIREIFRLIEKISLSVIEI